MYSQPSAGKTCHGAEWRCEDMCPCFCPAWACARVQPFCTINWGFEIKMCPLVPFPVLMWGGNLYKQRGPKRWQELYFQLPPQCSPKTSCRDLDFLLITETFVCLAMRGRGTLSSSFGDRLSEVPTRVNPYSYPRKQSKLGGFSFSVYIWADWIPLPETLKIKQRVYLRFTIKWRYFHTG